MITPIEDAIKHYPYAKFGHALQAPYGTAWVGYKFSTEHFNNLKRFPGEGLIGFSIALPDKYKEKLDAIPPSHENALERRKTPQVKFMSNHNKISSGSLLKIANSFAQSRQEVLDLKAKTTRI